MFSKKRTVIDGRNALVVSGLGIINLVDTLECGQAFRYEKIREADGYVEYMTVVEDIIVFVGQKTVGELIFYDLTDDEFGDTVAPYFALDRDFEAIRKSVITTYPSEWLINAANCAAGINILKQSPWEALFSFIVSQNNNIPRIRKIIRAICREYGDNLAISRSLSVCPLNYCEGAPEEKKCKECGACFSFPTAEAVMKRPEGLLPSHPGFRYKYLLDAAESVSTGRVSLTDIEERHSYEYTISELKKILGVGDKVASCAALFGFANYEAFPIDVWMKRAINEYFDGKLDPKDLGEYAGVAQQYIFHYIRKLNAQS